MRRKGDAPRPRRAGRPPGPLRQRIAGLSVLLFALASAGCSYIFSEIRTVYEYEPSYGVDSPDFRRSLEVLGTELSAHNRATLLRNGDETFGALLEAPRFRLIPELGIGEGATKQRRRVPHTRRRDVRCNGLLRTRGEGADRFPVADRPLDVDQYPGSVHPMMGRKPVRDLVRRAHAVASA